MQLRSHAAHLFEPNAPLIRQMTEAGVPGATVCLISGGKRVFSAAFGVKDRQGTAMTTHTLFEAASLTKSLFAVLVLQEADAGKLSLDAPIAPLLEEAPWSDDPRFLTITPRQALCHGSGLPNWQAKPMQLRFAPGEGYSYSGEGYFLLQRLVEQIEGAPMHELFAQRFFAPCGMTHSAACWTPEVGSAFSLGFDKNGQVTKVRDSRRVSGNAPEPNAAWSLYSNAEDYAAFLCGLLDNRCGLSQAAFSQMTAVQNHAFPGIDWGLGFGIPQKQPQVLWHWGDNDGFKSFAVWDRQTGDGMTVFTNSDNGLRFYMQALGAALTGDFFDDIAAFIAQAE